MKLTLIGAGPGDPDLITIAGAKALGKAKSVLYDALVHPDLLDLCPNDCVKTFAGKRRGKESCTQNHINFLIGEYASKYGEVIRLKGGDSFVFGRGYEEWEYAASLGISVEIVPGLSSSLAIPTLLGIPVTTRGLSESFWVITGMTKSHQISNDIRHAAQSSATVIVLMGLGKLSEIVGIYSALGKRAEKIAIIQNGSLPDQKVVFGNILSIEKIARQADIQSPAIIIIGKVVGLMHKITSHSDLKAFSA